MGRTGLTYKSIYTVPLFLATIVLCSSAVDATDDVGSDPSGQPVNRTLLARLQSFIEPPVFQCEERVAKTEISLVAQLSAHSYNFSSPFGDRTDVKELVGFYPNVPPVASPTSASAPLLLKFRLGKSELDPGEELILRPADNSIFKGKEPFTIPGDPRLYFRDNPPPAVKELGSEG